MAILTQIRRRNLCQNGITQRNIHINHYILTIQISGREFDSCPEFFLGFLGHVLNRTTDRVLAEIGSLGTPQHLDSL